MKIAAISDTHCAHDKVIIPDGVDVICHAGDISGRGELTTISKFNYWMGIQDVEHKIAIAGNHDFCFEDENRDVAKKICTNFTYLEDQEKVIDGVKFYGTPWQPWFYNWAFNVEIEERREEIWARIPDDTDVLIVHGPPYMHGDECADGSIVGCKKLAARIREIKPKYVICGHIHESYGRYKMGPTEVINASIMNLKYEPVNAPIILEI
jgi:Icc-related predicted phosphoesterase